MTKNDIEKITEMLEEHHKDILLELTKRVEHSFKILEETCLKMFQEVDERIDAIEIKLRDK